MPSKNRRFKDDIYDQFAKIAKALSAPKRLEILELLCQAPRTVEVLAKEASASTANTSRHLQVLRRARLVEADKRGLHVRYRPAGLKIPGFVRSLRLLGEEQLEEVAQITRDFLGGKESFEAVDREALARKIVDGSTILLDVRPAEEYEAGHIAGARHVPLAELTKRLASLPKHKEIVAYCRGPYCVLAIEAVRYMTALGYRASRLKDSVADWQAQGLPVIIEGGL